MTAEPQPNPDGELAATMALPGLARALIAQGALTLTRARQLYADAQRKRSSFIAELIEQRAVSPRELAHIMSAAFAAPLIDLDAVDPQRLPYGVLSARTCQQFRLLPLARRGHRLTLACADPSDPLAAEKVKFETQLQVDWVVAEVDKLDRWVQRYAEGNAPGQPAPTANETIDFGLPEPPIETVHAEPVAAEVEDAPIVRFLRKMLLDAYAMRASDLHFEPYEKFYRVRFRIDGQLREVAAPPLAIKDRLAARIKVLSRLDIAEKRVPQDGRMKLRVAPDKVIDFRVSTLPTLFGEKIVIRILDPSSAQMGIDALGYEPDEQARLLAAIQRPHGMVLVTGPTGSGKTVTLYSCLHLLNQPGVNISTAEDPAEIILPGINQVNVNEKAGLTFAAALRAFLRQDPDVIMVGEIRDLETADIAIKAAQTGHLVLSTLHTNDAPSTLTRLMHMGVAPLNIAASVHLITAQRLVRRLCPHCKQPHRGLPRQTLLQAGFTEEDLADGWQPFRAVGCPACHDGYKGRIGLYQVMPVSEAIQQLILRGAHALDIAAQARREGVRTLRENGLRKVKMGITSLEEVLSATHEG
ncbi:putative type II secretion system protein HxcR [Tepidimonas alkaliphilus]|uniref:Putative type II secretion system protein HxcR n=1 Tax=Tepidimonas alkaliphilus TaxID=2588942 RepID=A0A554W5I2_9BURK|nr:type IV-A pilus assembly ATPase PilB [Tepidimonas alkaliphilus]TSE18837.1 putative type II secretion system protein HxcR [Tepidimonas alkaliphilus]